MRTIPIASITIGDRQRKEHSPKALELLKRSIVSKGLLHAPVISIDPDSTNHLRAGERRLRASRELHEEGTSFLYDGESVPVGTIPYTTTAELSPADLFELELEENILREDLTWLELAEAKVALHKLRLAANPEQTLSDTAREIAERKAGTSIRTERHDIAQALIVVKHKDDPRVSRAKSQAEAFRAILDQHETIFQAELTARAAVGSSPHTVIHGDCRDVFETLPQNTISTIIVDPPYGISADTQGKESNHYYDDSPETALDLCRFIIREGFRISRPRALLFMFCDIEHFITLRTYAAQQAWSPFRTPIVWNKGSGSRAPWGRGGFTRSYELLLLASKGQAELRMPGGKDVIDVPRSARADRTHAADKPFDLLQHLVAISTLPGETILDPCAGSGPLIPAATARGARLICIESDPTHYAEALSRLAAPGREMEELQDKVNVQDMLDD